MVKPKTLTMYIDCPDCYGTGDTPDATTYNCEPIPCKHCDGSGEVDDGEFDEETAGDEKAAARREPDYPTKN